MTSAALCLLSSLVFLPTQAPPQPEATAPVAVPLNTTEKEAPATPDSSTTAAPEAPDDAMASPPEDPTIGLLKHALALSNAAAAKGDIAAFDATLTRAHRALLDELLALSQGENDRQPTYERAAVLRAFANRNAIYSHVKINEKGADVYIQSLGVVEILPMVFEEGSWKLAPTKVLLLERDRLKQRKELAAKELAAKEKESGTPVHTASDDEHDHDHDGAATQPATSNAELSLENAPWWLRIIDGNSAWHYMLYAPDYAFIAGTGGLYFSGFYGATDALPALIGPRISAERPLQLSLNDYRLDGVIGKPYLQEKVPTLSLIVVGLGAFGAAGVVDGVRNMDFHHTHAFVVGGLTAITATMTAVELSKIAFGRLRPDYRDRYNRAACSGTVDDSAVDCDTAFGGGPFDGFGVDEGELRDGRKSFPSGHAASSFAIATYLSLYIGGEYLWGDGASGVSMPIATGLIGLSYGLAAFSAASRISDNRHHPEDVAVGAVLGTAVSAASYFIHFDLDGNARYRATRISPMATEGGGGVQISGEF